MMKRYRLQHPGRGVRLMALLLWCGVGLTAAACRPGVVATPRTEASPPSGVETVGLASYYARSFHGRETASGIPFDANALVAAHPAYPFGTRLRVTNLENGRSVEVEVVDRGPASGPRRDGVIVDLSPAAASVLGFITAGRTRVRVTRLSTPPRKGRS